jgi:hypothetical protein
MINEFSKGRFGRIDVNPWNIALSSIPAAMKALVDMGGR